MSDAKKLRYIGIVLFADVEELDAIGPWEVLSYWCRNYPEDEWTVTIIHPGGQGTRPQLTNPTHLDWVRRQRQQVPVMASVCTGSLVYAAAGLLSGRPATTHWASIERLASLDPTIEVRACDRFVDNGDVVTSAGFSAGIDMALHLVDRLAGTERARQVRKGIQYEPKPPV